MITLYLGSMKSSKTSRLIEVLDKAQFRWGIKSVFVRPQIDDRSFISRYDNQIKSDILVCKKLNDIIEKLKNYHIICIDEGQFFEDLGPICNELSLKDIEIYIAALNGDSDMKPWESISNCLPYVDEIYRLSGVCENCGKLRTTFSFHEGIKSKIEIGDEKYKIYCRKCWNEKSNADFRYL